MDKKIYVREKKLNNNINSFFEVANKKNREQLFSQQYDFFSKPRLTIK